MRLALAVGLTREEVEDLRHVLPAVRFAVDAYVNFARRAPWQEAVCSSLTELFAPEIHKERLATWPEHYPWIETTGLAVLPQPRDAGAARCRAGAGGTRSTTSRHGRCRNARSSILQFKLDILWAMNDAMALGYASKTLKPSIRTSASPRIGRGFRLQWEPVQDCHVLLYPEGMVKLNESAGEILKRCDGSDAGRSDRRRPGERVPDDGPRSATCALPRARRPNSAGSRGNERHSASRRT